MRAINYQIPGPNTPIPSSNNNVVPAHPLLTPVTMAGCVLAFVSWNNKEVGALATVLFTINAVIGIWGSWTVRSLHFVLLSPDILDKLADPFRKLEHDFQNHGSRQTHLCIHIWK